MPYDPERHLRRSFRLHGYDYTQAGLYFVTIVAQDRIDTFGEVLDGEMRLNDAGAMVQAIWDEIPAHYPGVDIDAFVVMPNHIHGIIALTADPVDFVGAGPRTRPGSDFHVESVLEQPGQSESGQPQGVAPAEYAVGAGPPAFPDGRTPPH